MSLVKTASAPRPALDELDPAWTRVVVQKVRSLRYGSVHIKVHDAQVVLVEATEQTRFELTAKPRS
jgi:hypothetical protein